MTKKQNNSGKCNDRQKSGQSSSVIVPDTGKRGVQPVGTVKPDQPHPTPPILRVQKDGRHQESKEAPLKEPVREALRARVPRTETIRAPGHHPAI